MRTRMPLALLVVSLAGSAWAGVAGADSTSVENGVVVIRGSEVGGAFPSNGEGQTRAPELVGVPFEWRRAVYRPKVAPPCYLTSSPADETLWGGTERRGLLQSNYCPWY